MDTAACAFCGTSTATSAMDMTGHGWRCSKCALTSELDAYRNGPAGMADHLTRGELETVVQNGGREALLGVAIAIGGLILTLASLSAGGRVVMVFGGAMAAGFGMAGHGLHRRREAARIVKR
jgi:hypothetical protein